MMPPPPRRLSKPRPKPTKRKEPDRSAALIDKATTVRRQDLTVIHLALSPTAAKILRATVREHIALNRDQLPGATHAILEGIFQELPTPKPTPKPPIKKR